MCRSRMSFSRQAHMFQLNSYSAATHIKWNLKNPYHTVSNIFAAAFCVIAIFTDVILVPPAIIATVLYVFFALSKFLFKNVKIYCIMYLRILGKIYTKFDNYF